MKLYISFFKFKEFINNEIKNNLWKENYLLIKMYIFILLMKIK